MARRRIPSSFNRGFAPGAIAAARQAQGIIPDSFHRGFAPGLIAATRRAATPAATPAGQAQAQATGFTPDAQYLAEAAQRQFNRNQQLAGYNTQSAYDKQDTAEAIRRMLQQRTQDLQTTTQNANRQGLFYSGQLGKQLGLVNQNYQRQQDDATLAMNRREAARTAARQAIMQGAPIEEAAALAEAADRKIQTDQQAAQANALTLNQHATQVKVAQARAQSKPAAAPTRQSTAARRTRAARQDKAAAQRAAQQRARAKRRR